MSPEKIQAFQNLATQCQDFSSCFFHKFVDFKMVVFNWFLSKFLCKLVFYASFFYTFVYILEEVIINI